MIPEHRAQQPAPEPRRSPAAVDSVEAAEPAGTQWRAVWLDAAIVLVLAVVAYLTREGGLPHDGLWHDDAWVATGVVHGTFSQLITVGSGHPGFTGALMVVEWFPGGSATLVYPAFAAGVAGPPCLYLGLRAFGFTRSISVLLSAALVASWVHIMHSNRVKTYVLDVLIVLGVAVLLPLLARRYWRWKTAAAWVVGSVLVGSFSGFALVATAIAGGLLVLHPATEPPSSDPANRKPVTSDRFVRIGAVAAQAAAFLGLFVWMQRSSDLAELEANQELFYDGHIDFSRNPLRTGVDIVDHFARVVDVFPVGGFDWPNAEWLLVPIALVALAGLIGGSLQGRWRLPARFMLAILVFAIVGALLGRFPFGAHTEEHNRIWAGARSTLWLVPMMAVGLAIALQWLRRRCCAHVAARTGFDLTISVLAVVMILSALDAEAPSYPFPGTESAMRFVESEFTADDAVIFPSGSVYTASAESSLPVRLLPTPGHVIGFVPRFADDRVLALPGPIDPLPTRERIARSVDGADRVLVVNSVRGYPDQEFLNKSLRRAGFEQVDIRRFDAAEVVIWRADPGPKRSTG